MLHGCHSPVGGRFCFPVVRVYALRVRFDKAPLPLSVCSVPKEVIAEASEDQVVKGTYVPPVQASMVLPRKRPRSRPFLCCVCPRPGARLVLGAVLLQPGTWAAYVAGLSQDLSTLGLASSCGVGWVEWESSHWEMNHCILLPRGCLPKACISVVPPGVHAKKVHPCWTHSHNAHTDSGL